MTASTSPTLPPKGDGQKAHSSRQTSIHLSLRPWYVPVGPITYMILNALWQPEPDMTITLDFDLNMTTDLFTANGKSFKNADPMPVLLQVMSGKNLDDLMPEGSIYYLPRNKTVEVQMPALALAGVRPPLLMCEHCLTSYPQPHPIHLHGHAFWVIESAGNNTQNTVDPLLRDVVAITSGPDDTRSDVKIRFRTDNPGPWILHCHM